MDPATDTNSFELSIPATIAEFSPELKTAAAVCLLIAANVDDPEAQGGMRLLGSSLKQLLLEAGIDADLSRELGITMTRRMADASKRATHRQPNLILPPDRKITQP